MGTWKNLLKGFTVNERLSDTLVDIAVWHVFNCATQLYRQSQESEIVTADTASASSAPETVSSTANYDNEEVERESLTNKNDSMEQTQQSPSPNNSIATFEQYLQDIEIEKPTTEVISQAAILKRVLLQSFKSTIK